MLTTGQMAGDVLRRLCSQFGPEDQRAAQLRLCHHTWAVYPQSRRAGCPRQTPGRSRRGLLHGQIPARKKRNRRPKARVPSLPGDVLLKSPPCCAVHGIHLAPNLHTEPKELGFPPPPPSSLLSPEPFPATSPLTHSPTHQTISGHLPCAAMHSPSGAICSSRRA